MSLNITSWDRVVTSAPINKTAAQAMNGSDASPELTPRQLRENLLPTLAKITEELTTANPTRKKELGQQKLAIQNQLKELNARKIAPGYASHFIEAARDLLPKAMFRLIGDETMKRVEAAKPMEASDAL